MRSYCLSAPSDDDFGLGRDARGLRNSSFASARVTHLGASFSLHTMFERRHRTCDVVIGSLNEWLPPTLWP